MLLYFPAHLCWIKNSPRTSLPAIGINRLPEVFCNRAQESLSICGAADDLVLASMPLPDIGKGNGEGMKTLKRLSIALVFLSVSNLFAANKGSLHVSSPEEVAGQPLAPGDYVVRWEDRGPDVDLRIMQGRKIVATAIAHKMLLQNTSIADSVLIETIAERRSLSLIFFSGSAVALEIRGPSRATTVSSK